MKTCRSCGRALQVISSLAADPHDEPVYDCPCWPVDWPAVTMQAVIITAFVGLLVLAGRCS